MNIIPTPPPSHAYTIEKTDSLYDPVTCAEAFSGLKEPGQSKDPSQNRAVLIKYYGKRHQGDKEHKLETVGYTVTCSTKCFRRLSKEHGGKHKEELEAGLKERAITPRECARLQTFPDDYEIVQPGRNGLREVYMSNGYDIMGNAVPPVLAFNIAMRLNECWARWFGKR